MTEQKAQPPLCSVAGCDKPVQKANHTLCHEHWKAAQLAKDASASTSKPATMLTSTKLGERFNLAATRINQILAELGWIEKQGKGWAATDQGRKLLAEQRKSSSGISYVAWPEPILRSRVLTRAIADIREAENPPPVQEVQEAQVSYNNGFRTRFRPTHRTSDGHWVRSQGEADIDNWLYTIARLPHAYERRVPIDEDLYCDFFLPEKKVYIEYWGMEDDPAYLARKEEKLALYAKHQLNLIQLNKEHIKNLDDHLPKELLKFGIRID
jgi:hypothetical protein